MPRKLHASDYSIRWLLIALVASTLAPVLLFAAFIIWRHTATETEQANGQALHTAESLAFALEREMRSLRATLEGLSLSPALARDDFEMFSKQAESVSQLIDVPIDLRGLDGQHLANTEFSWGDPLPKLYVPELDDRIQENKASFVSDLFVGYSGKQIIAVIVPVFKGRKLKYTLRAVIEPERLKRVLLEHNRDPNWVAVVYDRQGRIIARTADLSGYVGKTLDLVNESVGMHGVRRVQNPDDAPLLRGYKRTADGWLVSAFVPIEIIDAPLRQSWGIFLLAGAASLTLAIPWALLFAKAITKPIRAVAQSALQLSRGDVAPVIISPIREINKVSQAIHAASIGLRQNTRELTESEARFRSVFEQAAVGFEQIGLDGKWMSVNDRLCAMLGMSRDDCLAHMSATLTHPDDAMLEDGLIAQLIKDEIPSYSLEKRYIKKDGEALWVRVTSSLARERDGTAKYRISVIEDITERRQTQAAAARLATLVQSSSDAIISLSLNGVIETWNPAAEHLFGYEASEIIGQTIDTLAPPRTLAAEKELLDRARDGDASRLETQLLHKNGTPIDVTISAAPIRSRGGIIIAVSHLIEDIRERKEWDRSIALLNRELQHRNKNLLAVVQSIADQTMRNTAGPGEFRVAFQGRLQALAASNDLLNQTNWAGADLATFIDKQLKPHIHKSEIQLKKSGPSMRLPPSLTIPLGLALHELGTNALKYGALAAPGGKVEISWCVLAAEDDGLTRLDLTWQERGGPLVTPPTRQGFGSTLINRGIPGAVIERQFNQEGVRCRIVVELPEDDEDA